MTELFKLIPLFGAILGILLGIFIFFSKSTHAGNSKARYLLALVILMTTFNLFEYYLWGNINYLLYSYLFYHLTGFVYLLYVRSLLKLDIKLKLWLILLFFYTVIHIVLTVSFKDIHIEVKAAPLEIKPEYLILLVDYYIALTFNVVAIISVYKKVKVIGASSISSADHLNLVWSKKIIGTSTIIYLSLLLLVIVYTIFEVIVNPELLGVKIEGFIEVLNSYMQNLIWSEKLDALLTSFFIYTIAIWAIRIPVFSSYEPILEKESTELKKYAKSTLKDDQSEEIWNQLIQLMENEKLYQNPTLRLNDFALKIGKSLPHISQVINEKLNMNFLDFVNQYRVKEAKALLCDEKFKSMTILAIAYEVGFNSKSTFYTSFKKITGQTPSEYKKSRS